MHWLVRHRKNTSTFFSFRVLAFEVLFSSSLVIEEGVVSSSPVTGSIVLELPSRSRCILGDRRPTYPRAPTGGDESVLRKA